MLGKCLDVNGGDTTNGTVVDLYDCNGTGAQTWTPQPNGTLVNPQSGKCLTDTGSGGSGTQTTVDDCTGAPNQHWTSLNSAQPSYRTVLVLRVSRPAFTRRNEHDN